MSRLSCLVGIGGIRELLNGKIWEWNLSFRREWEWDGNGNEVIEMGGGIGTKNLFPHTSSSDAAPAAAVTAAASVRRGARNRDKLTSACARFTAKRNARKMPAYARGEMVKVKFFHTRYRALGPELIPVYTGSQPAGDLK